MHSGFLNAGEVARQGHHQHSRDAVFMMLRRNDAVSDGSRRRMSVDGSLPVTHLSREQRYDQTPHSRSRTFILPLHPSPEPRYDQITPHLSSLTQRHQDNEENPLGARPEPVMMSRIDCFLFRLTDICMEERHAPTAGAPTKASTPKEMRQSSAFRRVHRLSGCKRPARRKGTCKETGAAAAADEPT